MPATATRRVLSHPTRQRSHEPQAPVVRSPNGRVIPGAEPYTVAHLKADLQRERYQDTKSGLLEMKLERRQIAAQEYSEVSGALLERMVELELENRELRARLENAAAVIGMLFNKLESE